MLQLEQEHTCWRMVKRKFGGSATPCPSQETNLNRSIGVFSPEASACLPLLFLATYSLGFGVSSPGRLSPVLSSPRPCLVAARWPGETRHDGGGQPLHSGCCDS